MEDLASIKERFRGRFTGNLRAKLEKKHETLLGVKDAISKIPFYFRGPISQSWGSDTIM